MARYAVGAVNSTVTAASAILSRPTVGRLTLQRLRYGAILARATGLPILVAGGASNPGIASRAALMQRVLERELSVAVRAVEGHSSDTLSNAHNSHSTSYPLL